MVQLAEVRRNLAIWLRFAPWQTCIYLPLLLALKRLLGRRRFHRWFGVYGSGEPQDSPLHRWWYALTWSVHEGAVGAWLRRQRFRAAVIDVGANVGQYTSLLAHRAPLVIAIEPHPVNYRLLRQRVHAANVRFVQAALSDYDGTTPLFESPVSMSAHSLRTEWHVGLNSAARRDLYRSHRVVQVMTLPRLLDRFRVANVALVKLDVEGAELAVLHGAVSAFDRIQAWLIEVHVPEEQAAIVRFLRTGGYHVGYLDRAVAPHLLAWQPA